MRRILDTGAAAGLAARERALVAVVAARRIVGDCWMRAPSALASVARALVAVVVAGGGVSH